MPLTAPQILSPLPGATVAGLTPITLSASREYQQLVAQLAAAAAAAADAPLPDPAGVLTLTAALVAGGASALDAALQQTGGVTVTATDFEEGAPVVGAAVAGWDKPWATSFTAKYADRGAPDGFVLEQIPSAGAKNVSRFLAAGNIVDGEVLGLVRTNFSGSPTARAGPGIVIRGSGPSSTGTCYYVSLFQDGTGARSLFITAQSLGGVIAQPAFAFVIDTDYWIRFRFQGTALKVKAWARGDAEPAAWTWEGTDAQITAAGWVGIITASSPSTNQCVYYATHAGAGTIPVPAELA